MTNAEMFQDVFGRFPYLPCEDGYYIDAKLQDKQWWDMPFRRGIKRPILIKGVGIEVVEAPEDIQPVKHGRWIEHDDELLGFTRECSVCHIEGCLDGYYCPNCGAKMDGET